MPLTLGQVYAKFHTTSRLWRGGTSTTEPNGPPGWLQPDESVIAIDPAGLADPPTVQAIDPLTSLARWTVTTWRINANGSVQAPTTLEAWDGSVLARSAEDQEIVAASVDIEDDIIWTPMPMDMVVTFVNVGATYDATVQSQRLPYTLVQLDDVVRVILDVRYDKVGTGTVSWQLWDEAAAVEVVRVDDAAGSGVRYVQSAPMTITPATSVRRWRLRVKSTTAADDPVFLGACVAIGKRQPPSTRRFSNALQVGYALQGPAMPVNWL